MPHWPAFHRLVGPGASFKDRRKMCWFFDKSSVARGKTHAVRYLACIALTWFGPGTGFGVLCEKSNVRNQTLAGAAS
jgi:hypothetical protein